MQTPSEIPANPTRRSAVQPAVLWIGLLAIAAVAAALLLPPISPHVSTQKTTQPDPALTPANADEICLRLSDNPAEYLSDEEWQHRNERRRASCAMAFAAAPYELPLKVAAARAMPHAERATSLALLREAAAQGSAEAYYWIYQSHKSWDRGDLDVTPLVTRAEADHALRRAAELDHPQAMQTLAILLDRGGTVKRDAIAARHWAERAANNAAREETRAELFALLGRLLATSDKPEERARGLDLLEQANRAGVFGAKASLAVAIRAENPVRARALLEEARQSDPGGAIPPLAEMLIAGERAPADSARALTLLRSTHTAKAEGVLGQLYLEGRLVPRDPQEAARLIGLAGAWDLEARTHVLRILATNPEVRVARPKELLYDATEAAELDEPGALAALVALKLSDNAQFRDPAGACKLIEAAVARGDQAMAPLLAWCHGG